MQPAVPLLLLLRPDGKEGTVLLRIHDRGNAGQYDAGGFCLRRAGYYHRLPGRRANPARSGLFPPFHRAAGKIQRASYSRPQQPADQRFPAERGMGSSAASAIAIIRAFFDYYDEPLDRTLLLQLADVEEQITHRSPSGLDAATVSSDKPLFYVKGRIGVPIEMNLDASLVIADTGKKGATKEAILAVKDELKNNNEKAEGHIKHLGELVNQTKDYLTQNDIVKLGDALNFAQTDLAALNVSDPSLDHLIHVARDNGALGAKLTGGGRGGCMIALMQTAMGARRLASILKENGAHDIWLQPLDKRGNN